VTNEQGQTDEQMGGDSEQVSMSLA